MQDKVRFDAFALSMQIVPEDSPDVHIVRQGETLFSIAKEFGLSVAELRQLNDLDVRDSPSVGQYMVINPPGRHIVRKGETAYRIASMYNIDVADLKRWNNMDGNAVEVGQRLIITQSPVNTY